MKLHDVAKLIALVAIFAGPIIGDDTAKYGLPPVAGAWIGLLSAGFAFALNKTTPIGDGE